MKKIESSGLVRARTLVVALGVAGLLAAPAAAQSVIDLGTDSVGSVVNTTGSTLAKVISQNSKTQVRARAYAGPEAWMPEMDAGKIQIGAHLSASFYSMYNQFESKLHLTNLRIIRSSRGTAPLGFMVKADSPIKTVADLKGMRVTSGYGGQPVIRVMTETSLKVYGLSNADVTPVPVVAVVQGVNAVVDGRADAAWASTAMPQVREAHTKVGIRFIPFNGITPAQEEELRKGTFPSIYADRFGGNLPYLPANTLLLTQEMYLGASSHTPDAAVKTVLQALWDAEQELVKAHPVMSGWINKAAVSVRPVVPYHPAAVAFYKEKGVWSPEAEKANMALSEKKKK